MSWADWVRSVEVEPSIYAADFARLGEQVDDLLSAGARVFHFDIGDGHFVEPVTIGPIVLQAISPLIHARGGVIDCHLMVANPERHFAQVAGAGGDSVTFHVEASRDPSATVALARELALGVGIAFNPETPVGTAVAASRGCDLVLCMSIAPGYSGQRFMPDALGRLRELRSTLHAEVLVQVDGGITFDNVRQAHEAGADLLVAGSSIFHGENLPRAYERLVGSLE
jgi:ribulose-phosphate 3-epimerase